MRMVTSSHTSSLRIFAVVATMTLAATPLLGQGSPAWPLPVVTPTSTPTPEPAETAPAPTPTPQPSETPAPPEDDSTPTDSEPAASQPVGASNDEVPKKDQVTNPGDMAFTDYAPFDLDEIEPEPMR